VGNVVTGKGNIVASRKHAGEVSQQAVEIFLGVSDDPNAVEEFEPAGAEVAESVAQQLQAVPTISLEDRQTLLDRIADRQSAVAYPEDIATWLARVGDPC